LRSRFTRRPAKQASEFADAPIAEGDPELAGAPAVATRFYNYALDAAITAAVLLLLDAPHPSNYSAVGDRVLWTLAGVGIVLVMLLADLLAKRARRDAKAQQQPA
jgi:hypothetical protein